VPAAFPILARNGLLKAAEDVVDRFDIQKRGDRQITLMSLIAEPLADAATAKTPPQLVGEYRTSDGGGRVDGTMTCVKARGKVFIFHRKMQGSILELRCYEPMDAADFKLDKLCDGGVAKLYKVKDGSDVNRITLDVGSRVRVYMNGKPEDSLDQAWGRGVAEVALALISRAHASAQREEDVVEIDRRSAHAAIDIAADLLPEFCQPLDRQVTCSDGREHRAREIGEAGGQLLDRIPGDRSKIGDQGHVFSFVPASVHRALLTSKPGYGCPAGLLSSWPTSRSAVDRDSPSLRNAE